MQVLEVKPKQRQFNQHGRRYIEDKKEKLCSCAK